MTPPLLSLDLPTPDDTAELAARLAALLRRGDTLLLSGPIGAGKSTFARAAIRARLGRDEEVPSPTFTLVQVYEDAESEIWHCDLYRLTDPGDVWELGLDDAFTEAICLIEWPDRLGDTAPATALRLDFAAGDSAHRVTLHGDADWQHRLEPFLD